MKLLKISISLSILILLSSLQAVNSSELPEYYKGYQVDNDAYLKEENKNKVTYIFYTLVNTNEFHSHNLGGIKTNKVYTHKDGHKEAVYDANGKLVKDCLNMGSYNYYSVSKAPLMHFSADTLPWIHWGNCENDPSSKLDRITAFASDFLDGSFRVIKNWDKARLLNPESFKEKPQYYALNLFLQVLNQKELEGFKFDGSDSWMTNQQDYDLFYNSMKSSIIKVLNN